MAWESPNRTILTLADVSPKSHGLTSGDCPRLTHCSLGILAMSLIAAVIVFISGSLANRTANHMARKAMPNEHNVTIAARYKDNAGRLRREGWNRIGCSTKR